MSRPAAAPSPATGGARRRIYLVDGSGYIFRAYHALPPMTRADGTPVNAVRGFCAMLQKLLDDTDAEALAVIFDAGSKTFRNELYPAYKAHRPDAPEDLVPQFPLVRDATRAFGRPAIEKDGFEADDLIATYARIGVETGHDVVIVSSDKDLMQLVRPGVTMLDPIKSRMIGEAEVREKFGVGPERVVDVQALAGDAADNVPGVPGIGIKTAAMLIAEYGDLDTLLARAGEIKQPKRRENLLAFADQARLSRELVRLRDDVSVDEDLSSFALTPPDPKVLGPFLAAQEFKSMLARLEQKAGAAADAVAAPRADKPAAQGYVLIDDEMTLAAWIGRARAQGLVALDCETSSLSATRAELIGVSLALAPGEAAYIPLGHRATGAGELALSNTAAPKQIPIAQALTLLRPLLEDAATRKIGHNLKFDLVVLAEACARHAPNTPPLAPVSLDDTMLASFVLDAGRGEHGLKELALSALGERMTTFAEATGGGKTPFAEVPVDRARDYAAADADMTLRLWRLLARRLVTEHMVGVYETIERPLIGPIIEMERAGIRIDPAVLRKLSQRFAERMAELEAIAHKQAGGPFNLGSPKQLGEVLFAQLGLAPGRKGKSGAFSTGADVLEDLAAQGQPLPRTVLDWRLLAKLKSTYADTLVEQVNSATGRVHTSFGMTGAQTGRLSSNDPNLQNIPIRSEEGREIRNAFIAAPGCLLVSLDYSQIELRIVAHVAEETTLIEAFRQGQDIHALTASQVFGVPLQDIDAGFRRRAKAINFGIIYGISPFGLARNLGIDRGEAKAYIDAYFQRYPGIKTYMDSAIGFARALGFVRTIFGRKIHLAGIADKNPSVRGFAERQAINAPIQGAAADIIKRAMARARPALDHAKLQARMLLQVHDELLFEAPAAEVERTIAVMRKVMTDAPLPAARLKVPLVADAGSGRHWGAAH